MVEKERVQKIIAHTGIASRRKSEELITQGFVTINGRVAKLGDKAVFRKDHIKVQGKLLQQAESFVYIAFYKPQGVIATLSDPEGRKNLSYFLKNVKTRVFPVGRLEYNTDGLVLLTNDGNWAQRFQKGKDIPRVYDIKVKGHFAAEALMSLERPALRIKTMQKLKSKTRIEIIIKGHGVSDLKTFLSRKGFFVERMCLKSIDGITLKNLRPGEYYYIEL
ncbi:MAG: rRNA pseudouridine synthase [Deltaproteobacteria bacterium]|nr:rRNA pseudouridine synthase [Deltaproteobacteria bacterium]